MPRGRALLACAILSCSSAGPARPAPPLSSSGAVAPPVVGAPTASAHAASTAPARAPSTTAPVDPGPPPALACIARDYVGDVVPHPTGWALALPDGSAIPFLDPSKSAFARYESPDVRDVFELVYHAGPISPIVDPDYDPGRVRLETLMRATYGASAAAVQAALVDVRMRGQPFRVHRRIEAPFRRVAARLDDAARAGKSIDRFFRSPGGTFNWRFIAGTKQLSMHSWGIAIDLDPSVGHYWRNEPEAKRVWKNSVPQAIVDAFEAEGFIWGGRWFHYDTMHFEYRPELLDARCYPPASAS